MTKRNRRNAIDQFLPDQHYQSGAPNVRKFVIKYLNQKQKEYGMTIQQNILTLAIGSAGSGKTHLAALHAMEEYLAGNVEKIIVCRPVITAGGEEIGFLPGTLNEKMDVYVKPIFDAFAIQWNPKQIQTMLEYGKIEIAPLAFMRGRTFTRSFIIADEMENCSDQLMYMLLTRLGANSKMVITGDPIQTDIHSNALLNTIKKIGHLRGVGYVIFDEDSVVRHPLVKGIVENWYVSLNSGDAEIGALPAFITGIPTYINGAANRVDDD